MFPKLLERRGAGERLSRRSGAITALASPNLAYDCWLSYPSCPSLSQVMASQRAGLIMMRVSAGLFAFLIAAVLAAGAGAQTVDPASPPAQVRELLKLLGEPAVHDWLNEESKKLPRAQSQTSAAERPAQLAAERLALARARLNRLGAVIPSLPDEGRHAAALLGGELQNHNPLGIIVLILGFPLLGLGAEWAFRRGTRRARERAEHASYDLVAHRLRATGVRFAFGLTSVAVFALGSIGAFLVFEWPPVSKQIVLAYLVAAVAWRVALLLGRLLLEPR